MRKPFHKQTSNRQFGYRTKMDQKRELFTVILPRIRINGNNQYQKLGLPVFQDPGCFSIRQKTNKQFKSINHSDLNRSQYGCQASKQRQKENSINKLIAIPHKIKIHPKFQNSFLNLVKHKQTMLKSIANRHQDYNQKRKYFKNLLQGQSALTRRQKRINITTKDSQIQKQLTSASLNIKTQTKHEQSANPADLIKPINILTKCNKNQGLTISMKSQFTNPKQGCIVVKQITTPMKPPQRYKTSMVYSKGRLFLYGGLGCEKNISWSELDLKNKQWSFPNQAGQKLTNNLQMGNQYSKLKLLSSPLFGHTMNLSRGIAYVFGGSTSDTVYDLTIINIKEKMISVGPKAPFRRRQHASILMGGKYLIVHGGIQVTNGQPKRDMFYYNTQSEKWDVINNGYGYNYIGQSRESLPALSHHAMVCTEVKTKKKIRKFSDLCLGTIYIFGGRTEDGQCSNRLYRVKIKDQHQVIVQLITYEVNASMPEPRHMCCFQYIGKGFLLLYGGKSGEEDDGLHRRAGVFNDIFLFNTESESWIRPQLSHQLGYRYGMTSSVSFADSYAFPKVYIFGGCNLKSYCDASVLVLNVCEAQQQSSISYKLLHFKSMEEEDEQGTKQYI